VGRPVLAEFRPDHVLFSFHGLPERQVKKSDPTGAHCLASAECCDVQVPANRWCYRAQCFFTARELASRLGLEAGKWTVAFQSRLGRTPWIHPYTDVVIPELAGKGVKRLAVFSPAFVADCLETLEEIGIRAKAQFLACGGEALTLVPSLNAHPSWVRGLTRMLRELRGEETEPGAAA
jgi:ferrochelatase